MSEELTPVRCGCGGEAELYTGKQIAYTGEYLANVGCKKCGIAVPVKVNIDQAEAEAEAVQAWNRAMTPHCCMTCQNWHWSKECSTNARDFCDDYEGWS